MSSIDLNQLSKTHSLYKDNGYGIGLDILLDQIFILKCINNYFRGVQGGTVLRPIPVYTDAAMEVAKDIRLKFPGGYKTASPFKKAAIFVLYFVHYKPLPSALDKEDVGSLISYTNHQNVIIALIIAIKCLKGAELNRDDGVIARLDSEIQLTRHSFADVVDAISDSKTGDWKLLSIFFEQLSYKTNSTTQYLEQVNLWIPPYEVTMRNTSDPYSTDND